MYLNEIQIENNLMKNIFIDTETAGLVGPIVLLQYAINDSPVILIDIWKKKIQEIIDLLESFVKEKNTNLIFFNAAFDWFGIYKMWTVLLLMDDKNQILEDCIDEYAAKESSGRYCKLCMKPQHVFDVMLHARKTAYQSTMQRNDLKIRRVPNILAQRLADKLNETIKLSNIYFARRKKDRNIPWKVYPCKNAPEFSDVVLKFAASSGLKALAIDALDVDPDETLYYSDVGIPKNLMPYELPYAPFNNAIPKSKQHLAWPKLIRQHIAHWKHNKEAREYAKRDVEYTRQLYWYFDDNNTNNSNSCLVDDDDSILSCLVAVCRWRGYRLDIERIKNLREKYYNIVEPIGFNPDHVPTAPKQVMEYLSQKMTPAEKSIFISRGSTGKVILEQLIKDFGKDSEVGIRVRKVQEARDAKYKIDFLNKLLRAGRLHPDLSVIGTLSSRMAGKGKLNATGIKRTKEIRSCFPLANEDEILLVGDFCVPSDTWTMTSKGPRQVRELINQDFIAIVNGFKYETKGFFYSGKKEVFEIETKEGYILQATGNHPVLVNYLSNYTTSKYCEGINLWKEISEVKIGDKLWIHNHKNIHWDGEGNYDEGYLLGWMYGDGCYSKEVKGNYSRIRGELPIHPDDFCVINYILNRFDEYPDVKYDDNRNCYRITSKELEELRIKFDVDENKIINQSIEKASSIFLNGFLSGFFDADASVSKKQIIIKLSQSNLERLQTIQRILLRFGICCKIKKTKDAGIVIINYNKPCIANTAYELIISKTNIERFIDRIGFINPRKKKILEDSLNKYTNWRRLVRERYLVEIKSIKSIGIRDVYDIKVPNIESFDANGFIVHNCSFEVALAAAHYNDPNLTKDLLTCFKCKYEYKLTELSLEHCPQCGEKESRQKIHGLFGTELYPGYSYEEIVASKGTSEDKYSTSKNGVFSKIYGGDWNTLVVKYGIPEDVAKRAEIGFDRKYKNVKISREKILSQFCSMVQPRGIGTRVIWREPSDYIESMLGFRRYFTLENKICKALFDLANKPPEGWNKLKIPIVRRDRVQMVGGAVQSALYASAFNIQSSNMRAAANHVIQSTGSQINKRLQAEIWSLQPKGIHEWVVQPLNIHDELAIPIKKGYEDQIEKIIYQVVEGYRNMIPLIAFDYKVGIKTWANK